jgi:hypothetical protein
MIFAKAIAGLSGTTLLAGALVFHEGLISVDVRKKKVDGSHVRLYVPATVVSLGMMAVPQEKLEQATRQAVQFLPAARIGVEELAKCPDAVLVEVRERDEHVRIEKRGGRLIVAVDSPSEEVHVAVPLQTIGNALREIEAAQPGS